MPKVLDCFHTFCLPCIEKSLADPNTIICSECTYETHLSRGPLDLVTDYAVKNVMESSLQQPTSLHCTGCKNADKVAVAKCYSCENYLCANCVMAHQFMHCFEGHKILSFTEIQDTSKRCTPPDRHVACPKHPQEMLDSYCNTCCVPICQVCIRSEHNVGHECQTLEEVSEKKLDELTELQNKVKIREKELQEVSKKLKTVNTNIWSQYRRIQNNIDATYNYFQYVLESRREELLKELREMFNEKILSVNDTESKVRQSVFHISHGCEFIKKLTKYGNVAEMLLTKCFVEKRFQSILGYYPDMHDEEFGFEFLSNFAAIEPGVQSMFGYIYQPGEVDYNETTYPRRLNNYNEECQTTTKQFPCQNIPYSIPDSVCDQWNGNSDGLNGESTTFPSADAALDLNNKSANASFPTQSKSHVKRQKMIYHCKFGEFGTLNAQFTEPSGVAVNAQNDIIIADTNNHRIQIFNKDGRFKFQFGECGKRDGQLLYPNRVAIAKSSGDIVVTERSPTHQVQIYNQYGQFVRKFGASVLQHPRGVSVDSKGRIVIVECKIMRVIIFDQFGAVVNKFGCLQHLEFPNGVVVNDSEEIFISDNRAHCVKVFNYSGLFLRKVGGEGITNYPIGVGLNSSGAVVIADNHNNFNVTLFTQQGQLLGALESKVKHAQCFDVALLEDNSIILASKDYRIYVYRYSNYKQSSQAKSYRQFIDVDIVNSSDIGHVDIVISTGIGHVDIVNSSGIRHVDIVISTGIGHVDIVNSSGIRHVDIVNSSDIKHVDIVNSSDITHVDIVNSTGIRHVDIVNML
ncbi:E3 ubiquitin-protein ligase TRIM56-like [Argonauta hians]